MKRLVALLFLLPIVQGISLGTDEAGDVTYRTLDVEAPSKETPTVDILSASMEEDEEALRFSLELATLSADSVETFVTDLDQYFINFTYDGARYSVNFVRLTLAPISQEVLFVGGLYAVEGENRDYLSDLEIQVDEASATLTADVPRELIQDEHGAPLRLGHQLTDFAVRSVSETRMNVFMQQLTPIHAHDDMPSSASWTLTYGLEQTGTILLDSDRPVRVSNGEATTFLFEVRAINEGDALERFQLSTEDAPPDWLITLPDEVIAVESGKELTFPVLITVPFRHEHGLLQQLLLVATSQTNPENIGKMELGVRYTEVPQPAGHHNQLYLHNMGGFDGAIMNTDANIVGDENIEFSSTCSCAGDSISRHEIRLSPSLEMGLDFDMDAIGSMEIDVAYTNAQGAIELEGYLGIFSPGQRPSFFAEHENILATLPRTEAQAGSDQLLRFNMDIVPQAYGDYWPYESGAQLILVLDVYETSLQNSAICCFNSGSEELVPGAIITLPLNEYHDDVSEYFSTLSGLSMLAVTPQKQMVNAGNTVVFEFDVENDGSGEGEYALSLTGEPLAWASILGDESITVQGKDTRRVAIEVTPPSDARLGEQADITLHAQSTKDPNIRSLVRVLAEVTVDESLEDQSAYANELRGELQEETPFLPLLMLVGLFLAIRHKR